MAVKAPSRIPGGGFFMGEPPKTAHLLRCPRQALPAAYREYASVGPAAGASHLDGFGRFQEI